MIRRGDAGGRDRELAVLDEAVARAQRGERGVVMLTGEPGIGKTRLPDELAARVTACGGRVAWGRCSEVGLTLAFWPWLQILVALGEPDDPAPALASLDAPADASARLARSRRSSRSWRGGRARVRSRSGSMTPTPPIYRRCSSSSTSCRGSPGTASRSD